MRVASQGEAKPIMTPTQVLFCPINGPHSKMIKN